MEDYPDDGDSPDDNDDDGNSGPRKRRNSLDDDSGPRRVRLRITRSSDYWQKRARGMSPLGSLQEGPIPHRVTFDETNPDEPPSKRRAVLEDIPEEEMEEVPEPQDDGYSPSLAPDDAMPEAPMEPDMPELPPAAPDDVSNSHDEVMDDQPPEHSVSSVPEPSTSVEQQLEEAIHQPVPEDDELMVDVGSEKCRRSESVLEVSLNVCRDDISGDHLCLWHVLDECLQVSTPKAKLRRVEVSYRKLSPSDKELFKKATQKEWQSWVDNKVTSLCKKPGYFTRKGYTCKMGTHMEEKFRPR